MNIPHIDRRKSRELDDPFPPDLYVKWNRWLVVWDLKPGQWSISPQGEVFQRLGEKTIKESKRSVIC